MSEHTSQAFVTMIKELGLVYQILSRPVKDMSDHNLNLQAITAFINQLEKRKNQLFPEEWNKFNQAGMSLVFNWMAMKCYGMNFLDSFAYIKQDAIYN